MIFTSNLYFHNIIDYSMPNQIFCLIKFLRYHKINLLKFTAQNNYLEIVLNEIVNC